MHKAHLPAFHPSRIDTDFSRLIEDAQQLQKNNRTSGIQSSFNERGNRHNIRKEGPIIGSYYGYG